MANQQQETTGNGQSNEKVEEPKYSDSEKQGKDKKTYNFRSSSIRAKSETKRRGKEDNINLPAAQEKNSDIISRDVYAQYAIDLVKQKWNMEYVVDGFITNMKEIQRKQQLKNTRIKHATSVK